MAFETLLADEEKTDYFAVRTHITGPRKLLVALELFHHGEKASATAIVSVDLDSLATELLFETDGETIDYAHAPNWHGLVQAKRVIEVVDGNARVTETGFTRDDACCHAIERVNGRTVVSGVQASPTSKYTIDGFIAEVTGGALVPIVQTSSLAVEQGELEHLAAHGDVIYSMGGPVVAANSTSANKWQKVLLAVAGGTTTLHPLDVLKPLSLYASRSGEVWIGAEREALVLLGGDLRRLKVEADVRGIVELGGTTYLATHGHKGSKVRLWRCRGDAVELAWTANFHWLGYRSRGGRRDLRICASDDLLVVTNHNRLHVYDGKKWSQLTFQRSLAKLVKRGAAGMKS